VLVCWSGGNVSMMLREGPAFGEPRTQPRRGHPA
jgi:hypothetical protein